MAIILSDVLMFIVAKLPKAPIVSKCSISMVFYDIDLIYVGKSYFVDNHSSCYYKGNRILCHCGRIRDAIVPVKWVSNKF